MSTWGIHSVTNLSRQIAQIVSSSVHVSRSTHRWGGKKRREFNQSHVTEALARWMTWNWSTTGKY